MPRSLIKTMASLSAPDPQTFVVTWSVPYANADQAEGHDATWRATVGENITLVPQNKDAANVARDFSEVRLTFAWKMMTPQPECRNLGPFNEMR